MTQINRIKYIIKDYEEMLLKAEDSSQSSFFRGAIFGLKIGLILLEETQKQS